MVRVNGQISVCIKVNREVLLAYIWPVGLQFYQFIKNPKRDGF